MSSRVRFRSVAQLTDQVLAWSKVLPRDIEVVAGIPRSGMLPASLLALYRNLPLTDVEGLLAGRCIDAGPGDGGAAGPGEPLSTPRRVLVVDDSVYHGDSMREVRATIEAARLPHEVLYGAVYVRPGPLPDVDVHHEVLPPPRFFEWNAFKHPIVGLSCIDMDVLSWDPDDGQGAPPGGHRFERSATNHLPTREVGWVVTSRSERHRAETEAWLAHHGVSYRELVMADERDRAMPLRSSARTAWKAEVYRRTSAQMYFVSATQDAIEICRLSGKDVLAVDAMHLVRADLRPLVDVTGLPTERYLPPVGRYVRARVPEPVKRRIRAVRRSPPWRRAVLDVGAS